MKMTKKEQMIAALTEAHVATAKALAALATADDDGYTPADDTFPLPTQEALVSARDAYYALLRIDAIDVGGH